MHLKKYRKKSDHWLMLEKAFKCATLKQVQRRPPRFTSCHEKGTVKRAWQRSLIMLPKLVTKNKQQQFFISI